MQKKNFLHLEQYWKTRLLLTIPLVITFGLFLRSNVQAQGTTVTVNVSIQQSNLDHNCHCDLCFCDPKIYWEATIDGVLQSTKSHPVVTNVGPFNPNIDPFQWDVDASKQNIPIVIAEYDASCWPSSDSLCDINPKSSARRLYMNLDLATCQISGDANGVCGALVASGPSSTIGDFQFMVYLTEPQEPAYSPGVNIRCLHETSGRIWPQPGEQVTITAEALDGSANLMRTIVDDIQIWVNDALVKSTSGTPGAFGQSTLTFTFAPDAGADQFRYRCRAQKTIGIPQNQWQWVSSGWRIVQIGQPASGRAVPILYNGASDYRLDLVFIANRNDYSGPNDSNFLNDVHEAIRQMYYAGDTTVKAGRYFLHNQQAMNFWIALDTGIAKDADSCSWWDWLWGDCLTLPSHWDTKYSFADSGAIVHTTSLRDFALRDKRIFEAWTGFPATFLHELGHSPVGLADEYCCDSSYFQPDPYPNIYELSNYGDCVNDSLATGVASPCQQIQWQGDSIGYVRVESADTLGDDLMQAGRDVTNFGVNPADERRLNWYFQKCRERGC